MAVVEGSAIPEGSGLVVGLVDLTPEEFERVYSPMVEPTIALYGGKVVIEHALVPTMAKDMSMNESKSFGTAGDMACVSQRVSFEKGNMHC